MIRNTEGRVGGKSRGNSVRKLGRKERRQGIDEEGAREERLRGRCGAGWVGIGGCTPLSSVTNGL